MGIDKRGLCQTELRGIYPRIGHACQDLELGFSIHLSSIGLQSIYLAKSRLCHVRILGPLTVNPKRASLSRHCFFFLVGGRAARTNVAHSGISM